MKLAHKKPHWFEDLATLLALLSAVIRGSAILFLQDPRNKKAIDKLREQFDPEHAQRLMELMNAAISRDFTTEDRNRIEDYLNTHSKDAPGYAYLKNLWKILTHPKQMSSAESKQIHTLRRWIDIGLSIAQIKPSQIALSSRADARILELVQYSGQAYVQRQTEKIFGKPDSLPHPDSDDPDRQNGKELAALLLTIFYTKGAEPAPAFIFF